MLTNREMREIFEQTRVVRRPRYGIISGYHELPYICLGRGVDLDKETTEIRGKIHVSPRFVIRPAYLEPSYRDIFGEENMDRELAGRIFGFLGFREKPVECKSEYLQVRHLDENVEDVLGKVLDEMERMEDIVTGVIVTPASRYYPISIERFIASILEDEFSV